MGEQQKIKLVLCWHMHQPHYRDGMDGEYRLPWVYLHAIKDYTDMVAHLENCPNAKVVVNFAPVLLEQLDDYGGQMAGWLERGQLMQDWLLNIVAGALPIPADVPGRKKIIDACQRCHAPTIIDTLPPFRYLTEIAQNYMHDAQAYEQMLLYLNDGFFRDLLMWYHLAWMGQSLRISDSRIQSLMDKAHGFTEVDQRVLVQIIKDAVTGIIPRYRALLESGQIELSTTPYGHPIVPLLLDFDSMREVMPNAPGPQYDNYPGGLERARWHMQHGLDIFEEHFGQRPKGIWLSEGAVSIAAIDLLDEFDVSWTATGQGVWANSCRNAGTALHGVRCDQAYYRPVRYAEQKCAMFFRDDGLSDLIGFHYKSWKVEDAVNNFAQHLVNISNYLGAKASEHVVSVVLDGENAWEYYANNANEFLSALYKKLATHPRIELTTFSQALKQGAAVTSLPVLTAGSWVYGSFSTWIGEQDKNLGWDILVEAKLAYDRVKASNRLTEDELAAATTQLAICEGSDWFWWFGDYNPAESVSDFELLYRHHIEKLYQLLGEEPPEILQQPISSGGGSMENSGTMRRS